MKPDLKLLTRTYQAKLRESCQLTARAEEKAKRLDDGTPAGSAKSIYIRLLDCRRSSKLNLEYALAMGDSWETINDVFVEVTGGPWLDKQQLKNSLSKAEGVLADCRKILSDLGIAVRHVTR